MNSLEIKNQIKFLQTQVDEFKGQLSTLFETELLSLMKENSIKSIKMMVNNHEFNDGDATYFSLYYEDLSFATEDGKSYEAYEDENKELKKKLGL